MPDKTSPTTQPTICPLHPEAVFDDNMEAIGNDRDIDLEHLPANLVDPRGAQRGNACERPRPVAGTDEATATAQCGGGRLGQQDGAHDLGRAGTRAGVPERVRECETSLTGSRRVVYPLFNKG